MPAIYPVATSRVTDQLVQARQMSQFEFDQQEFVRLQDQLSTGYRISTPSDDAPAAIRAITLQRLLEQKQQAQTNLTTTKSYVSSTDSSLQSVNDMLNNIRSLALQVVDTTTSDAQRGILSQEIQRSIEQLADVGNRQFRGRYLFAGSRSDAMPFELRGQFVEFHGNEQAIRGMIDTDFVLTTNVTGDEVFGAISPQVQSNVDLNPVLTLDARLANLRGGLGVTKGSFIVSDGLTDSEIDISSAETIRDVVRLIEDNPPTGRTVTVRLSSHGLNVQLNDGLGGNLTIREVPGGVTADQLGIRDKDGVGVGVLVGDDLNPRLLPTSGVHDVLGTRASAVLTFPGPNNDLVIEALDNGDQYNDLTIEIFHAATAGDQAIATYDEAANRLRVDVNPGLTTADTLVAAINQTGVFRAELDDKLDENNDGSGLVDATVEVDLLPGSGASFDGDSGIQLTNGGVTYTLTFENAETIEDILNVFNVSDAGVVATINDDGNGINVRSRLSGADLSIGENGGQTATQLGIRSFDTGTLLADLNFERGVDLSGGSADVERTLSTAPTHLDFTITRKDGVELEIDLRSATTVGDVLDLINNHALNTGDAVVARLAEYGNGIELYDENTTAPGQLFVTRGQSFAAWDLGLLPRGDQSVAADAATAASAALNFAPPNTQNTAITVTAAQTGFDFNGVQIEFQDSLSGDAATAAYDAVNRRLVVQIDAAATRANTVLNAINTEGAFTAALDLTTDATNNGTGLAAATGIVATTSGGAAERLIGDDTNPLEVKGVFNSLLKINQALTDFSLPDLERAVAMLDDDFDRIAYTRAELGARGRSLEAQELRLNNEDIQLRQTLSLEIDADLVKVISELTARQVNMEATLRLIAQTAQITLLNFL